MEEYPINNLFNAQVHKKLMSQMHISDSSDTDHKQWPMGVPPVDQRSSLLLSIRSSSTPLVHGGPSSCLHQVCFLLSHPLE